MWSLRRGAASLADVVEGEGDIGDARRLAEVAGVVVHLPTAALWKTSEWAVRLLDKDLEDPVRDLLLWTPGQWE